MVIKMSKSSQIDSVVGYNMSKVQKQEAVLLDSFGIAASLRPGESMTQNDIVTSFENRAARCNRKRTPAPVTHISLNPDPGDIVPDDMLVQMGYTLLSRLGYGNQPCIMVKHMDIARHHLHIVVSNIDEKGKKIKDSFERYKCNQIRRDLEREYGLHKAQEWKQREELEQRTKNVTARMRTHISLLLQGYRPASFNDYRTLLELSGIALNENATPQSEDLAIGLSYAFTDTEGNNTMPWIGASRLGTDYVRLSLKKRFEDSREEVLKLAKKPGLRKVLATLLTSASREELQKKADALGLTLVFRTSSTGLLCGLTVLDHKTKIIVKASDINRAISARAWQKFFPAETSGKSASVVIGRAMPDFATLRHRLAPKLQEQKTASAQATGQFSAPAPNTSSDTRGPHTHQEQADTHFHSSEDEEEELLRRKRVAEHSV